MPDASESLRASLAEGLRAERGDAPAALLDAVLEPVDVGTGEPLIRARPRSFDAVREAEALSGPGRLTPYWASAWPSGTALTRAVADAPDVFAGRQVLEVGCGLAMPSVAAGRAGATVLATDRSPEAVVYAAHNLALNEAGGTAAVADWTRLDALGDEWDVVLGADVLYTFQQADQLHVLVDRIVARDGEVWLADPGRAGCKQFLRSVKAQWLAASVRTADDTATIHRLRRRPRRAR